MEAVYGEKGKALWIFVVEGGVPLGVLFGLLFDVIKA